MKRSEIKSVPLYFDRYINRVDDIDLFDAFNKSIQQIDELDLGLLKNIGNKTYQPGKWTVKEILQHITDTERILTAGTLRFARDESDFVISFDETEMARKSKANDRSFEQIISELTAVRHSTIELFKTFSKSDFQKSGINWKHRITIEAMGFNIIGHQIHHIGFIENNYFTLEKK
ncbi:DinB family protein [Flavobacterium sp. H122]|uniref:DinB family protein n=1 Tax=Flavobacterium sp. H122 TaxID=2529860 RepID=UPI0010AA0CA1|nr:DinB family protein [Flavobacterium sp. H122]